MNPTHRVVLHVGLRGGAALLAFVIQVSLIRLLGTHHYGEYVLFATACSLAFIFACAGLDTVLVRQVAIQNDRQAMQSIRSTVRRAAVLGLGTALATVAVLTMLRTIPALDHWSMVLPGPAWMAAGVLAMTALAIVLSAARGMHRFLVADAADGLVKSLALLGLTAALLSTGMLPPPHASYAAFFAAHLFAAALALTVIWPRGPDAMPRASVAPVRLLHGRDTAALIAYALLAYAMFQLDTLLVGLYRGAEEAGIYNMVCNFVRLVIFVPLILAARSQPVVAVQFRNRDYPQLRTTVRKDLQRSLAVALGCVLGLAACGHLLLSSVGPAFTAGYAALCILALAHGVNSAVIVLNAALLMCDGQRTVVVAQVCGLALCLPLYWMLIPRWGMAGAAVAVLAGLCANMTVLAQRAPRHMTAPPAP